MKKSEQITLSVTITGNKGLTAKRWGEIQTHLSSAMEAEIACDLLLTAQIGSIFITSPLGAVDEICV